MENLRRWNLDAAAPFVLQLAADARLSRVLYEDDQAWELLPGTGDSPALALQTRYGGRVGLASIVPMWYVDGRLIYEARSYESGPVITAFAPGFVQIKAQLTTTLTLTAEYWVMESQAVGAQFTLVNSGTDPVEVKLELFGHVAVRDDRLPLAILTLADDSFALSMGRMKGLEPVVAMPDAQAEIQRGTRVSPKISLSHTISPEASQTIRWVHAGLPTMAASLERAQFWLGRDWAEAFAKIDAAALAIPAIETGDAAFDAAVAFSYQQLMQSFFDPTSAMPHESFVATRNAHHGHSAAGDGSDYGRGWNGQNPFWSYLTALAVAPIMPELAQGILENFLAAQAEDGSIDFSPGMAGQREGFLCTPLLARLAWEIYRYSPDKAFLKRVYPGLMAFFNRWSEVDLDVDGDVMPEWQDERQTGYIFWPTFGSGQPWAQNTDISSVESPDLVAYLLSELRSLQQMAEILEDPGAYELQYRADEYRRILDHLWYEGRYSYRERDTDAKTRGDIIIQDGRCDEEHLPAYEITPPSRLIVRISGGTGRMPRAKMNLQGISAAGEPVTETAEMDAFTWSYGLGVFTSAHVFQRIDRVQFEGLSRVYRLTVQAVDLTRLDINGVLPLWSGVVEAEKAQSLIALIADPEHFLRSSGLTIVSAQDRNFDPASANGGGGVWAYWTTVIGEALLAEGRGDLAAEICRRLMRVQAQILTEEKQFSEFYHADRAKRSGERGHIAGIVPLHLLTRLIGVQIVDGGHVWIGGEFHWDQPVTVQRLGVVVARSSTGTRVTFASGHVVELSPDAEWQLLEDENAAESNISVEKTEVPPQSQMSSVDDRVIIEVEGEPDNE